MAARHLKAYTCECTRSAQTPTWYSAARPSPDQSLPQRQITLSLLSLAEGMPQTCSLSDSLLSPPETCTISCAWTDSTAATGTAAMSATPLLSRSCTSSTQATATRSI